LQNIAKHCKTGDFLLVKNTGYINRKMIFSIFVSEQQKPNEYYITVKTADKQEYQICNNKNEIIYFSEHCTAMEVVRKLLR
jgi:hypothetical protein